LNRRYNISKNYGLFFDSFIDIEKDNISNYEDGKISTEIYCQLFKIHYFAGKYSAENNRGINHSLDSIFQDIIAYYLKVFLDKEYEVILEKKEGKYRPDILITKNNKNHFIIEIKTNIGWNRKAITDGTFEERIKNMSSTFNVKENNVIFIFESHGNVSKTFSEMYWEKKESKPRERPKNSPYNKIFPLFNNTDPYYMNNEFNRNELYLNPVEDKKTEILSTKNIVTKFEDIIKLIKK